MVASVVRRTLISIESIIPSNAFPVGDSPMNKVKPLRGIAALENDFSIDIYALTGNFLNECFFGQCN
jgi:hypothetical protein